MKKLDFLKENKELKAPHTLPFFGVSSGAVASVSLLDSMAVSGTVDSETSITGSDGVTYKSVNNNYQPGVPLNLYRQVDIELTPQEKKTQILKP